MAGLALSVEPRKRIVYHVDSPARITAPLTVDPSGVYFRSEGPAYIVGFAPRAGDPDPATLDLRADRAPFEEWVWPALAHRVPGFEELRLLDAWAGHYEVHTLDHNGVIGPHPEVPNFLFANGFSGHGLQQAPAVGRGLAEWIATGAYRTLDLSPLGYARVVRNEPIVERSII
jgi:glycine/D-amino acid oxidase-like deaminating enzyme